MVENLGCGEIHCCAMPLHSAAVVVVDHHRLGQHGSDQHQHQHSERRQVEVPTPGKWPAGPPPNDPEVARSPPQVKPWLNQSLSPPLEAPRPHIGRQCKVTRGFRLRVTPSLFIYSSVPRPSVIIRTKDCFLCDKRLYSIRTWMTEQNPSWSVQV